MSFLAVSDPSWFFSSLAQSTASVVGFVGAFLIFRIQDYTSTWVRMASEVRSLQGRWSTLQGALDQPNVQDPKAEREVGELWDQLRPLLDRRLNELFPRELWVAAALLGVLFVVGSVFPLWFLEAPSNGAQGFWLVLVAGLLGTTALYMLLRARTIHQEFKNTVVWQRVEGEHIQQLLNEEMWEEQDRERREERARLKQQRAAEEAEERQREAAEEDPKGG